MTSKFAHLSDNALAKLVEKLHQKDHAVLRKLIDAGRGNERPSETRQKSDPLSEEFKMARDAWSEANDELEQRKRLGSKYVRGKIKFL